MSSIAFLVITFSFLFVFGMGSMGARFFSRGYEYLVFLTASFIGFEVLDQNTSTQGNVRKFFKYLVFMWFIFLAGIHPIKSFQNEAVLGYPPSENIGMKFITTKILLNDKMISIFPAQQLIPYLKNQYDFERLPYNILFSSSNFLGVGPRFAPDIIVFRSSLYYRVLFRDLSLDNNRYTLTIQKMNNYNDYNIVYSSPTFYIYIRN
jgi:hypothetical protein